MSRFLLSLTVNNHFGVLARVSGLFGRRGYNIASLSVGPLPGDESLSRMSIETHTDAPGIQQVIKQLRKLEDVKSVELIVEREPADLCQP